MAQINDKQEPNNLLTVELSNARKLFWVCAFLITCLAAYYALSHYSTNLTSVVIALHDLTLPTFVLTLSLLIIFIYLDYLRFYTLLKIFGFKLTILSGLRLTCVSYCVSNLSPNAELHLPAMIYLLKKEGVSISDGAAVSISKSAIMVLWICISSFLALCLGKPLLPATIQEHLLYSIFPLAVVLLLLLALVMAPHKTISSLEKFITYSNMPGPINRTLSHILSSCRSLARIGRSANRHHLLCHVFSVVFIITYATIGFVLANALGLPISISQALAIFSLSLLIAYLTPIPGGIGVTELTTSFLLDPTMSQAALHVAIILRLFCWYFPASIGLLWIISNMILRLGINQTK